MSTPEERKQEAEAKSQSAWQAALENTPEAYHSFIMAIERRQNVGSRNNPDWISLNNPYMTVDGRVKWAQEEHREANEKLDISTEFLNLGETLGLSEILCKATVSSSVKGSTTGHAKAFIGGSGADSTNPMEVAECVPITTEILTRNGFRFYHQVKAGDEVLTHNVDTGENEWQLIKKVSTYPNQPLVKLMNDKGFSATCTPNHKWVVREQSSGRTSLIPQNEIPYEKEDYSLVISAPEAKSAARGIPEEISVDLPSAVANMTLDETRLFFDTAIRSGVSHVKTIFLHSMQIASARLGIEQNDRVFVNQLQVKQIPPQTVWCPTTDNGTWIARQPNGAVFITGNTSAIGRALGFMGYGLLGGGIASAEEVVTAKSNARQEKTVPNMTPNHQENKPVPTQNQSNGDDFDRSSWIRKTYAYGAESGLDSEEVSSYCRIMSGKSRSDWTKEDFIQFGGDGREGIKGKERDFLIALCESKISSLMSDLKVPQDAFVKAMNNLQIQFSGSGSVLLKDLERLAGWVRNFHTSENDDYDDDIPESDLTYVQPEPTYDDDFFAIVHRVDEDPDVTVSAWETEFIESMLKRETEGRKLTEKMKNQILKIRDEKQLA